MDIKSKSAEQSLRRCLPDNRQSIVTRIDIAWKLALERKYDESIEIFADVFNDGYQTLRIQHGEKFQRCFYLDEILKKAVNLEKAAKINRSLEKMLLSWSEEIRGNYDKRRLDEALNIGNEICEDMRNLVGRANPITLKMKNLIGHIYSAMQKYDAALRMYDEVYKQRLKLFGEDHRKTLNSLMNKANVLLQKCEFENARNTYLKVSKKREIILGPHHEKTLRSMKGIIHVISEWGAYNKARTFFEETYKLQHMTGYKQEAINTKKDLAKLYFKQRNYEKALETWTEIYNEECQLDSKHPQTLLTRSNIAKVLAEEGKYEEAIGIYNEILPIQKSSDIPENAMNTENNIAMILAKQKRYRSARDILKKLSTESDRILGPEHSTSLSILNNMGALLCSVGYFDEALTFYNEIRVSRERSLGLYHPDTLKATCSIARVYAHQQKYDEALRVYNEARDLMYAILYSGHIDCLSVDTEIAEVYTKQRKYYKAFEIYYDVYERKADIYGVDHRCTSEIKIKMHRNSPEDQRLIKAAKEEDLEMVKSCLEYGDSIDVRDIRGYTPLHIASEKGYAKMAKFLLNNGAIYQVKNMEGKTPTDIACNDQVKSILNLVHRLFLFVEENDCEQVKEILEQEKEIINAKDKFSYTPLHRACDMGHLSIVKLLLDFGVNHTAVSKQGRTPLHQAAFRGHMQIIKTLLEHARKNDADGFYKFVNSETTSDGMTALHLVARKNHLRAFELLLDSGATSYVLDKRKRSPFDLTEDSEILNLSWD